MCGISSLLRYRLLAWEVGLIHCRPSMDQLCIHHLCLRSGESRALFFCLEDLEDYVSECFIVPQMNCR